MYKPAHACFFIDRQLEVPFFYVFGGLRRSNLKFHHFNPQKRHYLGKNDV